MNIYIRREDIANEFRVPLVPSDVRMLIKKGFQVHIETSKERVYKDSEYSEAGAILTTEKWYHDYYKNFLIVGLKELYGISYLNNHTHIYFSHSFKGQTNSLEILNAFRNSKLYDFEYFLKNNKRVIAFGTYAGQAGCALGLLQAYNKLNNRSISNLAPWSYSEMLSLLKNNINLKVAIIGNGRCATGVKKVLNDISQPFVEFEKVGGKPLSTFGEKNVTFGGYDSDYTDLTEYDIIYNCILLDASYNKVWFDKNTIFKKPIIIVDISCDYSKPNNPIQLYNKGTTWENPVFHHKNVDIIAIDNLPSLLPKESSDEFSSIFRELLLNYPSPIWDNALDVFYEKIKI